MVMTRKRMQRALTVLFLVLPVVVILAAVTTKGGESPKSISWNDIRKGDLIFVGSAQDSAKPGMDDAIAAAIGDFTHVAIVISRDSIVDATPHYGVAKRSIKDFREDSRGSSLFIRRVRQGISLDTVFLMKRVSELTGKDYDCYFLPGNDKYYCSELVQECYRDGSGHPLFDSAPMNFYAGDGTLPSFWRQLFDSLQCPVPQGAPGTNPTDMFHSRCLE
jgi:uncharacterized protein YycO